MPHRNPRKAVEAMRQIIDSQSTEGQPKALVEFLFGAGLLKISEYPKGQITTSMIGDGYILATLDLEATEATNEPSH